MSTELSDPHFARSPSSLEPDEDALLLDENNLSRVVVDFSVSTPTRLRALSLYYTKEGGNNTVELINKLGMMYELSGTRLIRAFLFSICESTTLEPFLQSLAARALVAYNDRDELGYKAIVLVYERFGPEIGTPYKIEFVKTLMNHDAYRDTANRYFCGIVNDDKLACDYRYKTILGLDTSKLYFAKHACISFLDNDKNTPNTRILAAQYLLQKCAPDDDERNWVETALVRFGENEALEYNLRADATDVLLQLGSEQRKQSARELILRLGVGNRTRYTLYENAQNVHTKEIEESVREALEFLQTFSLLKRDGKPITLEYVEARIEERLEKGSETEKKVKVAFNRIAMDRALYSRYNCTLIHILLQVWTYLTGHDHEEEIVMRLVEELAEMAGTCSSGFATRLVNTISGFGDFSMKISWRDQIASNLLGRLNARIRDMDNLTLQEKVLEEMTIPSGDYALRKHFLKFLRANMLSIREELYTEFKTYITDTDFDLYFRAAISVYENGESC